MKKKLFLVYFHNCQHLYTLKFAAHDVNNMGKNDDDDDDDVNNTEQRKKNELFCGGKIEALQRLCGQ